MQPPILVFDLETIPDLATGIRLYPELADLADNDAAAALIAAHECENGTQFLAQPLHQIACLSCLWVDWQPKQKGSLTLKLFSYSLKDKTEQEILARFLSAFDSTRKPLLISWNGARFDLPVIAFRALQHGLNASNLLGNEAYMNRYRGTKNLDLMRKFADLGAAWQKLDTVAAICGLAGKSGVAGSDVLPMVQQQKWDALATYCESDVLNTWFVYLKYAQMMGDIGSETAQNFAAATRNYLQQMGTHANFYTTLTDDKNGNGVNHHNNNTTPQPEAAF